MEKEFRNILIIKPSAAGDVVCALPVLAALKEKFPHSRISWLIASHFSDLLRNHPMIDRLVEFDRRRYGYLARSWTVARRFGRFLKDLRREKYDLVIDLQGLFRSGFFARITGAPVRIGPAENRECGWLFYTHRIPAMGFDTHTVDRMAAVGNVLNLNLENPRFVLPIENNARQTIIERLREHDIHPNQFIAIAPGGTWSSKRWPAEKFSKLAHRIVQELDRPVVLIGGQSEKKLAEVVLRPNDPRIVSLAGETSIPELLAVLALSAGLVCNDSGPMHMAVALGRPVTAIIGPTNAHRTGPYRQPQGVVRSDLVCSPCYKRICPNVKGKEGEITPCMSRITVDQVFENLRNQLG